jgi:hypothetical protein
VSALDLSEAGLLAIEARVAEREQRASAAP